MGSSSDFICKNTWQGSESRIKSLLPAILPMTVKSPMLTTMPLAVPSTALVEKKAKFLVSKGFSWVNSDDLVWGSDSPVREELSTWKRCNQTPGTLHLSWSSAVNEVGKANYISANITLGLKQSNLYGRKDVNFLDQPSPYIYEHTHTSQFLQSPFILKHWF